MKKLLLLAALFLQTYVLACKCDETGKVGIQFQDADFVGEIEILKITPNKRKRSYTAEIKTMATYKGEPPRMVEVLGLLGDINSGSCEVELKTGEKYIAYLTEGDGDNIWSMTSRENPRISSKFVISSCTPMTLIASETKNLDLEREVLNFLRKNKFNLSQAFYFDNSVFQRGEGDFKKTVMERPANRFAVYKLKVNSKSEVEEIEAIQNFGSAQDAEIMKLIKKNFSIAKELLTEVRNEEVLLTLFYIPENKEKEFGDTITLRLPYTMSKENGSE